MYRNFMVKITLVLLLVALLVAGPACDTVRGGATVYLKNVKINTEGIGSAYSATVQYGVSA